MSARSPTSRDRDREHWVRHDIGANIEASGGALDSAWKRKRSHSVEAGCKRREWSGCDGCNGDCMASRRLMYVDRPVNGRL